MSLSPNARRERSGSPRSSTSIIASAPARPVLLAVRSRCVSAESCTRRSRSTDRWVCALEGGE
eukprot:1660397-Rhodomonas_salina.1